MGKKKQSKMKKQEIERQIKTQQALAAQDRQMWMDDEGISQLEARIATHNWQGQGMDPGKKCRGRQEYYERESEK